MGERLLVNHFYAQPVGHAIEALQACAGYHAADPTLEIAVALNAATPVELAGCCPFVARAYAIEHPFVEGGGGGVRALRDVPRDWDWVLDDARRHQQAGLFAGMRDYYAASDTWLRAARGRGVQRWSAAPPYVPHTPLRLTLPTSAPRADGPRIAFLPAGSSEPSRYPSAASWALVLDALAAALPGLEVVLIGRSVRDERTATALGPAGRAALLAHPAVTRDAFDLPLLAQLALVEACDVFLAPHTGFGMAALAVGTPWLALSGGPWFEWFFNHVPFRSVIPDTTRFPAFHQFGAGDLVPDADGEPRTPSMTRGRVEADRDRVAHAAVELVEGRVGYEQALDDYVADLVAAHDGDASAVWSMDQVHLAHLPR